MGREDSSLRIDRPQDLSLEEVQKIMSKIIEKRLTLFKSKQDELSH